MKTGNSEILSDKVDKSEEKILLSDKRVLLGAESDVFHNKQGKSNDEFWS